MRKTRFITTVFGRAGYGKTTFIMEVLPYLPRPVFVIDTMDEFSDGLVFYDTAHLVDYLRAGGRNDSGVYIVKSDEQEDAEAFFRIFTAVREPASIVVDEVNKFSNPNGINDDLKQIINFGRHWSQNLVMAARRSAEVHRDITAQSDVIVSFRQTEARDLAKMRESFNEADELARLDRGQFIAIGDASKVPFKDILARSVISSALD